MKVIEYWPNFVEKDESERKITEIQNIEEVKNIPWIMEKQRGRELEIERTLVAPNCEGYHIKIEGWLIAIVK